MKDEVILTAVKTHSLTAEALGAIDKAREQIRITARPQMDALARTPLQEDPAERASQEKTTAGIREALKVNAAKSVEERQLKLLLDI